ncbi:Hsp70 family protein [Lysobacter sp. TY2-98]|uniref:Hsp70 family protein n=1 Tax=Lysobacter sp. TY2-98 TaxID=2290922 RepID=UPI0013B406FF|nr:Hsp70 family protein [Lysobacter sp. TY2-98]
MRAVAGAAFLFLAGCGVANDATVIAEPNSPAISSSGVLLEPVGIETLGGVFTPLLVQGCKLPCTARQTFSTAEDQQGQISVHLLRGSAAVAKANHTLGNYQISGFKPDRRGEPRVAVEFRADAQGISLRAIDQHNGAPLVVRRIAP